VSGDAPTVHVLAGAVAEVGGASKATRLLCESLVSLGARTTLFVATPPDPTVLSSLGRGGVEVVPAALNRGWRYGLPAVALALQLGLRASLRPPTAVIAVGLGDLVRTFLALRPRVPTWLWETTEALPNLKFVDLSVKPHLRHAAGLLVPSRRVAENARRTYAFDGTVLTLPFWVDRPKAPPVDDPTSDTLMYLGRLDPDKGLGTLFEAFAKVAGQRPSAKLIVCGGGDAEPLRRMVAGQPAIEVRGFVDDAELEEVFREAAALVLPSFHEGYPLVLLEACGRGRPVIATSVGSIPEVYGDRDCALVVPPRDVDALAAAILRFLEEPAARKAKRGRDAVALFDRVSSPEAIHRALGDVLAASRAWTDARRRRRR
jgi:glycosyltransferase involved in cell wall biosynthesis